MENINKFKLTENAVRYLKKIISEMGISLPINEAILDEIVDYVIVNYETGLLDDDYALPKKGFEAEHKKATDFITEITGQWDDEKVVPDFDDLNERLQL